MQPAQFGVDVAEAGGQSGDVAGLMERPLGAFDGLAEDGALRLRLVDGTLRTIHAADVFTL